MNRRTLFLSIWYLLVERLMKFSFSQKQNKKIEYLPEKELPLIENKEEEETWGHFIDIDIYS